MADIGLGRHASSAAAATGMASFLLGLVGRAVPVIFLKYFFKI
jgi:hypothetical protein